MEMTGNDKVLQTILKRFDKLEAKIIGLEGQIKELKSPQATTGSQGKLAEQLADSVGLIGLKEAVTWQRRSIKWSWAVLLCLGLMATVYYIYSTTSEYLANPTATNVELARTDEYAYPSLVLCPGSWLDTKKALSMGLTIDALKYSIAYIDFLAVDETTDVKIARETFRKFYDTHNFSSLLDYFKSITVDLEATDSGESFSNNPNPSFMCTSCNETSTTAVEKVYVGDSMCYSFAVTPADARHFRSWSTAPQFWVKVQDRTDNVTKTTNNWRAYLMPDQHLTQPNFPSIAVEPFTVTTLKTFAQRFISAGDNDHFCYLPNAVPSTYSAENCIINCLHDLLIEPLKCHIFWYFVNGDFKSPAQYCNFFDTVPGTNMSFSESFDDLEMKIIDSEAGAACVKKCPYKCDRIVYTTTLDSKFTISVDGYNLTGKAKEQNMSLVGIFIDNTAISQGGILTLTEVNTFSFSTLVSNVGGTFGLFLGGTIMTFVQLIMFLINYGLDVRDKKRKTQST